MANRVRPRKGRCPKGMVLSSRKDRKGRYCVRRRKPAGRGELSDQVKGKEFIPTYHYAWPTF